MFARDDESPTLGPTGAAEVPGAAGLPAARHELTDLPLEHLEHEICELGAHIQAGTCRWLELIAEFDRREGWGTWGCRSCAEWVSWRCGLAPRAAREHVRVARSLEALPRVGAAFAAGKLSYSKVRALTRVASPESEERLLELAGYATAAQLERMVRGYRRLQRLEAQEQIERRSLSWYWDEDGSLCISARLAPEEGALFLRALEASREALGERVDLESGSAEPGIEDGVSERLGDGDSAQAPARGATVGGSAEPQAESGEGPAATNADAFSTIVETALARGPTEMPGGDRHQVIVHVDREALTREAEGRCELDDGPALAPETARRLGCDASLLSALDVRGSPISIGRRTRVVPAAMRRALQVRDRHCRFPGCQRRRYVDAHHVRHWARGGETSLDNLVLLCRHHHRLVHEGGFGLALAPDGELVFRRPDGVEIPAHPPPLAAGATAAGSRLAEPLRGANGRRGTAVESDAFLTGTGERMDLRMAVDAVLDAVERPPDPL